MPMDQKEIDEGLRAMVARMRADRELIAKITPSQAGCFSADLEALDMSLEEAIEAAKAPLK